MCAKLHPCEISIYFLAWISAIFYAISQVIPTGNLYSHIDDSEDLVPGWSFLGRKQDVSDFEWYSWKEFLWTFMPWVCIHLVVAEFVRQAQHSLLPAWYLCISLTFTMSYLGTIGTLVLLAQPLLFYFLLQARSVLIVWTASAAILAALNFDSTVDWLPIPEDRQYLLSVCVAWTHLRCLYYCLDRLADGKPSTLLENLLPYLSYVFYLPVLFLGPLISHEDFETGLTLPYKAWTFRRWSVVLLNLGRYFGWMLFTDFALHYVYCNALRYQPEVVMHLNPWALCGLGYCMGQFFMNKYVVFYGLPATVARAEQISAPHHPMCIARIHLYSDMWRYFDRGLHAFLVKHIYIPCIGLQPSLIRRIASSFVCFCFIYVWHRTYLFVLVWSLLNFVGITIENISKAVASTSWYQRRERAISPQNVRRCHALIASPLFAMSCISNFYFFAGMDIGNIYAKRLFDVSPSSLLIIFLCYCCCQVSIEVKNWEQTCAAHPIKHSTSKS